MFFIFRFFPTQRADSFVRFLIWSHVKPWPNGDVSWRKLKTWVNLWLRLARACVHLRWPALIWSRSNLHASRRKFFTVWPSNPSQRKLSYVHWRIISQWNTGYVCLEMGFCDAHVLVRKHLPVRLATLGKSPRKLNLRPLATSCRSVWPGLNALFLLPIYDY